MVNKDVYIFLYTCDASLYIQLYFTKLVVQKPQKPQLKTTNMQLVGYTFVIVTEYSREQP